MSANGQSAANNAAQRRTNPYVGPRAFMPGEKLFGRDRESDELLDLLLAERVVILHAPSGAGKTSLLQASLVERLTEEGLTVLPVARVKWRPEEQAREHDLYNPYIYSAMLDLSREHVPGETNTELETFADGSRRFRAPNFESFLTDELGVASDTLQVLIFDQFEELLTLDAADVSAKHAFCRELGRVLQSRSRFAVFAMREEFVGALEPYLGHFSTRLAARYRLDFLSPEAAELCIRKPVEPETTYDEKAVVKLVDDLRRVRVLVSGGVTDERPGAFIEPVHLQVVCTRIWNGLQPPDKNVITLADVERLGSVDSALRDYYASAVERAAREGDCVEGDIRFWIGNELIVNRLRGQALFGSERARGVSEKATQVLIDTYVIRSDERRGAIWFELAHDRLVGPVLTNNIEWQIARGDWLETSAARWREHEKNASYLLSVVELPRAVRTIRRFSAAQRTRIDDFLRASASRALSRMSMLFFVLVAAVIIGLSIDANNTRLARDAKEKALDSATVLLALNDSQSTLLTNQRDSLSKLVDSLSSVQDRYIYQRAWGLDSGTSEQTLQVSKDANTALQSLLQVSQGASPALPSRVDGVAAANRERVVVRYPQKRRDKQRIEFALREIGYTVEVIPGSRIDRPTNSIAYGPVVRLRDLKVIALTLVRGGTELRAICPVQDVRDRAAVAEVNYSARASERSPVTIEQINALTARAGGVNCAN